MRETYPSEPGLPSYAQPAELQPQMTPGRSMFLDPATRQALPAMNPNAFVPNQIRYGLRVQVVANQSQDPRGDIDNRIPTKLMSQLINPRLVGAVIDREEIPRLAAVMTPVYDSTSAVVGSANEDFMAYARGDDEMAVPGYSLCDQVLNGVNPYGSQPKVLV
jgi:hypothetical protein